MKSKQTLTKMQFAFVNEYIKNGFNAYQAGLAAGYSPTYSKVRTGLLIKKPQVQEIISKAQDKAIDKLSIDWAWKVGKLKRVIEEFIPTDSNIDLNKDRVKVGLTALAELNKMHGDYAPDRRLNMTVNATLEKLQDIRKTYDEY